MERSNNVRDREDQSNSNGNEEIQLGSTGNQRKPLDPSWTEKASYGREAAIFGHEEDNAPHTQGLKKNWTTGQTALQRFNTAFLRDTNKINEFKIVLNNRFQALQGLLKKEETTMVDNWKSIKEALTSTCQEVLGLKKYHHKEWVSTKTLDKIKEMKNKMTAINNCRTRAEKVQARTEYIEANKLTPMNPPDIEAAHTDLPIDVNPPTMEEIRMAIRQIKSGKAAEPDNIPAEALKSDMEEEEELLAMNWKEEHFIKIPKKEDLSKCENYRCITLLSVPGKVFNRVLLS
ncbi:unnamed protein product [Schistosoma curassoni]|uniref:Reverse transcriptase domain-containing protein n=1 Tax=Schistosoma curassoni TaxID=6186 RepID=A0A183L2V5_9TREM|nr:unnamed protein product [Schistosoma curassoni]